jgi:phosphomannomutase/phosphoglucomutase
MRFRKQASEEAVPGPKPAATPGIAMGAYWLFAFLGVALVVIIGMLALALLDQQHGRLVQRQQDEQQARLLLERVSRPVRLYREWLEGLGRDPALIELFRRNDRVALAQREQALTAMLSGALRVRLLSPGHDQAEPDAVPPLSFASLAMLRAAETAKQLPPVELHQAKTPQAHLSATAAVRDPANGTLVGLIHLAADVAGLRAPVQSLPAEQGFLALLQRVEERDVTLFGSAGPQPDGQARSLLEIPGSTLQLAYWPAIHQTDGGSQLNRIVVLLLTLLLAGLSVGWQYRRLHRAVLSDEAMFIRTLEEILAYRKPRIPALRLKDFHVLMALLMQRLKAFQDQATPQPAAQPRPVDATAPPGNDALEPADDFPPTFPTMHGGHLPQAIFRPYDIRGIVGDTLTDAVVGDIGRAIGSQAYEQGQQTVIVARDTRDSGPELMQALIEGLNATGRDVIDLGVAPVPVLYFATHHLGSDSGVMLTASHNPPQYNGLKVVIAGEALAGPAIQALRERAERGDLLEGAGSTHAQDLIPDYIQRISDDVGLARPLKVVLDCGSGSASLVAPTLFRELGCEVVELNCEVDNSFPGHPPDPSRPENLEQLQNAVVKTRADIGLAFDGDGDRLGVVASEGRIIWPDRLLMLLAADVLARHPGGDVIFDVKCSRSLASQVLQHGGRPVMWKSGHSLLKAKLRETGALLAGEWTGHIMFHERWYGFDDALYAGARLLEILSMDPRDSADVFAELPNPLGTPELFLEVPEGRQYEIMDTARANTEILSGSKLTTIDGLRAELEDGWGLMRASNTTPALSFRFEADDEQALQRIQDLFRKLLQLAAPDLQPPF